MLSSRNFSSMKTLLVLSFVVVAVFAADKYNSKYDNFDVETLISNERLLKSYIFCFLDKGRCTPEGSDFKSKSYSVNNIYSFFESLSSILNCLSVSLITVHYSL